MHLFDNDIDSFPNQRENHGAKTQGTHMAIEIHLQSSQTRDEDASRSVVKMILEDDSGCEIYKVIPKKKN